MMESRERGISPLSSFSEEHSTFESIQAEKSVHKTPSDL